MIRRDGGIEWQGGEVLAPFCIFGAVRDFGWGKVDSIRCEERRRVAPPCDGEIRDLLARPECP